MNTDSKASELTSASSECGVAPEIVAEQYFDSEIKTNFKESTFTVGNFKQERKASKMTYSETNSKVFKADGVKEMDNFLGVTGRDSLTNVRKRALEPGVNNICKAAKVVEENKDIILPVLDDLMHEGKLANNFDVAKECKAEYVFAALHDNPFGHVHVLCNSDPKTCGEYNRNYSQSKNIETCNVYNIQTLQMHKGCDLLNVDTSESVKQTEVEISEIINGISVLNLCSNLKNINMENRTTCKMNVSERMPAFSLETHCAANTGVVFPSVTKCRDTNNCLPKFSVNGETFNINKHGNLWVDGNDSSANFSSMRNGEKGFEIFRPFRTKCNDRKSYISAVKDEESRGSDAAENSPTEITEFDSCALVRKYVKKMNEGNYGESSSCGTKQGITAEDIHFKGACETNHTDMRYGDTLKDGSEIDINEQYVISNENRSAKLQVKDDISFIHKTSYEMSQKTELMVDEDEMMLLTISKDDVKTFDVSDMKRTTIDFSGEYIFRSAENVKAKEKGNSSFVNNSNVCSKGPIGKSSCDIVKNIFISDINNKNDEDDTTRDTNIEKIINVRYIVNKNDEDDTMRDTNIEKTMNVSNVANKNEEDISDVRNLNTSDSIDKSNQDDTVSKTSTVKNKDASDIIYKIDDYVLHDTSTVKNADATDLIYKEVEDDVVNVRSTVKAMGANNIIIKRNKDGTSVTSIVKDMDGRNQIDKRDEDNTMSDTNSVKNVNASDLIYKSDEDDDMSDAGIVKDMDASDQFNKSEEDDTMSNKNSVKDMDASDLIYKSDEDDIMSDTTTVKDMDASDQSDKSEEDDTMSNNQNYAKDMDASDLIYKSDEDDIMSDTTTVKDMDASDQSDKSEEDDTMSNNQNYVKDMDASDVIYKSDEDDIMSDTTTVKDMDASDQIEKNEEDNSMSDTGTVKNMDISDLIYKTNEDDAMSDTSTVKDMDAHDQSDKSEVDDTMSNKNSVKDMDASDLIYKSDEDDVMSDTTPIKDMDASDQMEKSEEDNSLSDTDSVKNMDISDLIYKTNEDDAMSDTSTVKDMDAGYQSDKSEEDDTMSNKNSVRDMDASDLIYKSDEDDVMSDTSTIKDMDTSDQIEKSEEDKTLSDTNTVKNMEISDVISKSDENDVMRYTSSMKDMDASNEIDKRDEDDTMSYTNTEKDMDASDAIYCSDEDDIMSDTSTVKDMDNDPSNNRNEKDMSDTSSMEDMQVTEEYKKNCNSQIGICDVDNLISLMKDNVSIRDAFNLKFCEDSYNNFSIVAGDEMDVKVTDVCDLEYEMLSVMSTDKCEDTRSTYSMEEAMSDSSVEELTDIHCYRNVDIVCSDSDSDTIKDEYESSDVLSTSYEEMSDATSCEDEAVASDYIEEDVDDYSGCGDYDENDDDDDDDDCDYVSCCEYDIHTISRDKDTMSCSSVEDTVDDLMSMTSNNDEDDEMSGLMIH